MQASQVRPGQHPLELSQHNYQPLRTGVLKGVSGPLLLVAMAAMLAAGLPISGLAAGNRVEICHLPSDNPHNVQTLLIDSSALPEHLAHGDLEGACPPTAAELDPPSVTVDPDLDPPEPTIAGVDGGPPRPLARMNSDVGDGYQFDFVENEVYLITDNPDDVAGFRSRWPSELLSETPFPGGDPSAAPLVLYLLQVNTDSVNTRRLDRDLAELDSRLHGQHQVSSEAALRLLALVAGEVRREGLRIGINALVQSQDLSERVSEEAMVGIDLERPAGNVLFAYTTNAFNWPYLNRDPDVPGDTQWPLDTGVMEAMRSFEAEGLTGNRVRAMIADGGFFPNKDFPPFTPIGDIESVNPDPGGCGRGHPATLEDDCGTHGTHVTMAGFGKPDNEFGTLGPGGNVSDLVLVQSPSLDFYTLVNYITRGIPEALSLRPKIINVSASVIIAGGWCFAVCEPIDELANWLDSRGIIFVAAAGNQGIDVDRIDEFCTIGCVTFEAAAVVPCESDHVICVGAMRFMESRRTSYSNYGTIDDDNSVDIFAPGDLYGVNAIQAANSTALKDDLQFIGGTSYASPFTAGLFALTWAADPAQSHTDVQQCVLSTAHRDSLGGERRRVDALGALSCAMGGTWPWVKIDQPLDGASHVRGLTNLVLRATTDDYEEGDSLPITWISSLSGMLGTSDSGEPLNVGASLLEIGEQDLCATVMDDSARGWQDCIRITVTSAPPIVEILNPLEGQDFIQSSTIYLDGSAIDPDGTPIAEIVWTIELSGFPSVNLVSEGSLHTSFPASLLNPGLYRVFLRVVDTTGATGSVSPVYFTINPDPANLPPVITVNTPTPGTIVPSPDGGPATFTLDASANDAEDGPIPFENIEWQVSLGNGFRNPLTVTRECLLYDFLDPTACVLYGPYQFELSPSGSNTLTEYRIYGRVQDSNGNFGEVIVIVFVQNLI